MTAPITAYRYAAELVRLVDADTQVYRVDLGYRCRYEASHRLAYVNAPETGTDAGAAATAYAVEWFGAHAPLGKVTLHSRRSADADKYGRWLAVVIAPDGRCLNDDLLRDGHAVPYS